MADSATWADFVEFLRRLEDRKDGFKMSGQFSIKTLRDLDLLERCVQSRRDTNIDLPDDFDPSEAKLGVKISVSVSPRGGFGILKPNLNELLSGVPKAPIESGNFYLWCTDASSSDTKLLPDHIICKYRTAIRLIDLLKECAAIYEDSDPSLTFLYNGRFDIPIEYGEADVEEVETARIAAILDLIPDDAHAKQCRGILGDAVVKLTQGVERDKRFAYLLKHSESLLNAFRQGYDLYSAEFSYDKIRNEVEAAKVEFHQRIHSIISDIQNQLLGIPVATVVVATQMKDSSAEGYNFWINTAVLGGCWIFALLMALVLLNQRRTLLVIGMEVERQYDKLKHDYAAAAANQFEDIFIKLRSRCRHQIITLWVIAVVVAVALVASHFVYGFLTPEFIDIFPSASAKTYCP